MSRQEREEQSFETSPDDIFASVLHNDLEFLGEELLKSNLSLSERCKLWAAFEKYYGLNPNKIGYGRLHNTRLLGQIFMISMLASEIDRAEDPSLRIDDVVGTLPHLPFREWSSRDWVTLQQLIEAARDILLRNDADRIPFDNLGSDESQNPDRCNGDLYNAGFERVMKTLQLQKDLAPLKGALSSNTGEGNHVDEEVSMKIWDVYVEEEDEVIKRTLGHLFESFSPQKSTRATRSNEQNRPALRKIEDLNAVLNVEPYDASKFHKRLVKLLRNWVIDVFRNRPILCKVYSHSEEVLQEEGQENRRPTQRDSIGINGEDIDHDGTSGSKTPLSNRSQQKHPRYGSDRRERLHRAREALQDGVDPLEESLAMAEAATGRRRSNERSFSEMESPTKTAKRAFYDKKHSSRALTFDDSDNDDSVEDSDDDRFGGPKLSSLPKRRVVVKSKKRRTSSSGALLSQAKKYEGRRKWSDEEKRAIREGIRSFGVGKWAQIKGHYDIILADRTSGQIKDCYRTMNKRGELNLE